MLCRRLLRSVVQYQGIRCISKSPSMPYTKEQQCQVLDLLNTASEKDLRKLLGPSYIMRIVHAREEKGPFDTLEDVFSIKGLTSKGLLKFCENVVYGASKPEKQLDKYNSILPIISDERILAIDTVCSLDITGGHLTLAKMRRDRTLSELKRIELSSEKLKPDLASIYEIAAMVYPQIPNADIYVIQYDSNSFQKPVTVLDRSNNALMSMLVSMLSFGEALQPKVVSIKSRSMSQLFKLLIGNERVSSESTFDTLLQNGEIKFNEITQVQMEKQNNVTKEFYRVASLQALAMFRICKI